MDEMTRKIITSCTIGVVCLLVIGGCARQQSVATMEQFAQAQTRTYAEVEPGQVHKAVQRIFELADPNETQVTYDKNSLIAHRIGLLLLSVYTEEWHIQTHTQPDGVSITVSLTQGVDGIDSHPLGIGPYELFFTRLEYLLGQSDTWMTCYDYEQRAKKEPTWGGVGMNDQAIPLCFLADDDLPEALRPSNTVES